MSTAATSQEGFLLARFFSRSFFRRSSSLVSCSFDTLNTVRAALSSRSHGVSVASFHLNDPHVFESAIQAQFAGVYFRRAPIAITHPAHPSLFSK